MRSCARAIIFNGDKILLMKRLKMGKEYYTLLGGAVEKNESPDQTAIREVFEESTIKVRDPKLVFIEEAGSPFGTQYVYLCDYISGEPNLPNDSEEAYWTIPGKNTYEPVWFPVDKLTTIPLISPLLREAIVMALKHGWPKHPYTFSQKNAARLS